MLQIRRNRSVQKGFSLIELMVVLFVGSILMGIGLPAMSDFMNNNRMSASANELNASLHLARTEAIKRRANVAICASADWDTTTPVCDAGGEIRDGWIVFIDADADLDPDDDDAVFYAHGPMNDQIVLTVADTTNVIAGLQFVSFARTGFPVSDDGGGNEAIFNFQLCDGRGDVNTGGGIAAGRWIQLTTTGRPQIHRTQEAVEGAANPTNGCG
jgi:type IV fimbrial biogenesis protein FimT